jgi:predicted negative regulator of RcsB-dependent stress response
MQWLAVIACRWGNLEQAQQGFERALTIAEQMNNKTAIQEEIHGLAAIAGLQERYADAKQGFEQALSVAGEPNDQLLVRVEVHGLAWIAIQGWAKLSFRGMISL